MKPFDKEKALAGDPVITRDGSEVLNLTEFPAATGKYTLAGTLHGLIEMWTSTGKFYKDSTGDGDLFMAPKKVTHTKKIALDTAGHISVYDGSTSDKQVYSAADQLGWSPIVEIRTISWEVEQ